MTLQFVHDNKGNTTGVFIPIEDWEILKRKYVELQKEEAENIAELSRWQRQILDERISDYYSNKEDVTDFDKTIDEIENRL